jgi:hypothetical protein
VTSWTFRSLPDKGAIGPWISARNNGTVRVLFDNLRVHSLSPAEGESSKER